MGGAELPPLPDAIVADPRAGWIDPRGWFVRPESPLEIEIGSGKGTFLVQQAPLTPGVNYLGIEWAKEYAAHAADRVRRRGLANVRVVHGDATAFLRWRLPDGLVRVIHLYFSDPWPKRKHHKNRVVQDSFLADAWRVLGAGGELRIVTDHEGYWEWMEEHFARWTGAAGWGLLGQQANERRSDEATQGGPFARLEFDRPESAGEGEVVGTNFERKFRREGRVFRAAVLRKRG